LLSPKEVLSILSLEIIKKTKKNDGGVRNSYVSFLTPNALPFVWLLRIRWVKLVIRISPDMSMENNVACSLTAQSVFDPYGALNCFDIDKSKINRGHFSTVYFAQNRFNGIKVALKQVQLSQMTDAKAIEDCKREVILLKQFNHPNVIKYLSHFIDNHDLYIVLELASAGDLSKMFKHFLQINKFLAEKTIWKFFCQISCGLEHMHSKRIMHRDIKPANIFINAEGLIKLGDLGLSRFFDSKTLLVYSDVGTPYYMSPERIDGRGRGYNFQSDIWSLACILYEMAVLRSPFYEDKLKPVGLQKKILALDYKPLSTKQFSTELCLLVSKCLVLDPEQRPNINQVDCIAQTMNTRFLTLVANQTVMPTSFSGNNPVLGNDNSINDV
jgi:NIMA (never in mitosis gene a)-related kinase